MPEPGYSVVDLGVIPDNKQLLEEKFIEASRNYDAIITTGGASLSRSNCYIVLPEECRGVQAGDQVTVEPFSLFF